ncbi:MAG: alpha/beta hydrolase [Curtobacterium sp.]
MHRRSVVAAALLLVAALAGCTAQTPPRGAPTASVGDPTVVQNIAYVPNAKHDQRLDACIPKGVSKPRPAIVVVHGGSFESGDKATQGLRYICTKLAKSGYDAFSINYRLLPAHPYPAALHDLQSAIRWIRAPAQVKRFDLDPTRVGAFGESAGAVLVTENGTQGSGSLATGTRTRAVVAVSTAPSFELSTSGVSPDAVRLALGYLGCTSLADCPDAAKASAITAVDASDPPFLLATSTHDFIPVAGSREFAAALQRVHVPVELDVAQGSGHGLQLVTPALAARIMAFYAAHL